MSMLIEHPRTRPRFIGRYYQWFWYINEKMAFSLGLSIIILYSTKLCYHVDKVWFYLFRFCILYFCTFSKYVPGFWSTFGANVIFLVLLLHNIFWPTSHILTIQQGMQQFLLNSNFWGPFLCRKIEEQTGNKLKTVKNVQLWCLGKTSFKLKYSMIRNNVQRSSIAYIRFWRCSLKQYAPHILPKV